MDVEGGGWWLRLWVEVGGGGWVEVGWRLGGGCG